MKKTIYLCFAIITLFDACNYQQKYINLPDDKVEGDKFLSTFYGGIHKANFEKLDTLLSDSLKMVAGDKCLSTLTKLVNDKVGNVTDYKIIDYYIIRKIGINNLTHYNYRLQVNYKGGVVEEIIDFRRIHHNSYKIYSYHTYSDLLMK